MDVSVVICTYNGAARLPQVFDCLAAQDVSPSIAWEVVVVDNNSRDRTAQLVSSYQTLPAFCRSSSAPASFGRLNYVFEPKQGLAFARRCAVQVASGALIAFLDDDNLPNPHWVQAAYQFGQQHPDAGAYGSQIVGRYEVDPPPNFERIACFLAVIDRGNQPFRYDRLKHWLFPAGAGLVVRKQAWLQMVPELPALSGVSAKGLNSKGEDIETLSYIRKGGWPIWHNPEMRIEHVIGRDRLTKSYLSKLFKGVGLSRYHTRIIRFQSWQRLPIIFIYGLQDLLRLLRHELARRRDQTCLVSQCERTLLYYSFLSPFLCFFAWSKGQIVARGSPACSSPFQVDSS